MIKILAVLGTSSILLSCQQPPQKIPIAISSLTSFPRNTETCEPPDPPLRKGQPIMLLRGNDIIAESEIERIEAKVYPEYLISEDLKELRNNSDRDIGDCISRAIFELPEGTRIPDGTELRVLFSGWVSSGVFAYVVVENKAISWRVR